jgi:hypothetical protein
MYVKELIDQKKANKPHNTVIHLQHVAPAHTHTKCYGVSSWCQDCEWDRCGNWYPCGVCFSVPW